MEHPVSSGHHFLLHSCSWSCPRMTLPEGRSSPWKGEHNAMVLVSIASQWQISWGSLGQQATHCSQQYPATSKQTVECVTSREGLMCLKSQSNPLPKHKRAQWHRKKPSAMGRFLWALQSSYMNNYREGDIHIWLLAEFQKCCKCSCDSLASQSIKSEEGSFEWGWFKNLSRIANQNTIPGQAP